MNESNKKHCTGYLGFFKQTPISVEVPLKFVLDNVSGKKNSLWFDLGGMQSA